jgi:hypothetical protein
VQVHCASTTNSTVHLVIEFALLALRISKLLLKAVDTRHHSSQSILLLLQLDVGLLQLRLCLPQLLALWLNNFGNPGASETQGCS